MSLVYMIYQEMLPNGVGIIMTFHTIRIQYVITPKVLQ